MEDFTKDEWQSVVEGPMVASFAITAADPGSFVGALQESMEAAKAMAEVQRSGDAGLIGRVVAAYKDSETRSAARESVKELVKGRDTQAATAAAVARLGDIAVLVRSKSPDEAADYLSWLEKLAHRVAEAGTEGGFLGFGGEKVSEAERRTLGEIGTALKGGAV